MTLLFNLLCFVGIFGVVGLVWALRVTGLRTLPRIARSFWFRPLAPQQVIANEQQDCTDRQFAGDPKRASATPATGSILSPGEGPTSMGITTIPAQETERYPTLEEICKLLQALVPEVVRLNHLLVEGRTTGPLQNIETLLHQWNDKVDGIVRKTDVIYHIISQGTRSMDINIVPPEAEVARSNHYNGYSSDEDTQTGNRTQDNDHRTTGNKDNPTSMKKEKLHRPVSPFEGQSDGSFVAEAEELVRKLNTLVEQASFFFADSLCYRESLKEPEDVLNELIGPYLCNKLRSKPNTEYDCLMITQLVLQSGLVNACGHIIDHGSPPALSRTYSDTTEMDQAVIDTQKAQPPTHTPSQSEVFEISQNYLAMIALTLITAVGGSLESGGALPPWYIAKIVKTSLALHKTVSEAATSMMELITYTIPFNTNFDQLQMEDTEEGGSETQDTVVCTLEMGLRCRKRTESSSEEDWDVAMKTKVVLASTLEA